MVTSKTDHLSYPTCNGRVVLSGCPLNVPPMSKLSPFYSENLLTGWICLTFFTTIYFLNSHA